MQFPVGKPPVGVLFDSDLGNRSETVLALAVLYGLDGKNEARVVAVSVSKPNLKSAALCEVIGRFYAGAVSGAFGAVGRTLPVGMATEGPSPEDTPMLAIESKPAYAHGIHKLNDTAEVRAMLRNALTAQYDQNSWVILAGPATNLAALVDLPGARDIIAKKSRGLVMATSALAADLPAAKKILAEWPAPVTVISPETGDTLLYPASSIEKDFAWSQTHPVVDAYRAQRAMPYDSPTGELAAVMYAIRPQENYFTVSEPGTVTLDAAGKPSLARNASGKHRLVSTNLEQKEKLLNAYIELASAKPVPRQRFRPPAAAAAAPAATPPAAPPKP